jgi:hypothetical protein
VGLIVVLALLKDIAAKAVIPKPNKKMRMLSGVVKVKLISFGRISALIHIKRAVNKTRIGGGILSSRNFIIIIILNKLGFVIIYLIWNKRRIYKTIFI